MRLPRDVSGKQLAKALGKKLGYILTRQRGSHMRYTTQLHGEHHAAIQVRELMREIQLKPTEAEYKVAVVVAADRLKTEAANAFLKTLEKPPPKFILILLSTEPQRLWLGGRRRL